MYHKEFKFASYGRKGFALVSSLTILVLLVVVALGVLSMATISSREATHDRYRAEAEANARLALQLAISKLQEYAGPDTRVTAEAAILENQYGSEPNQPHWLGVWKTTYTDKDTEYPMIGKGPDNGGASPYRYSHIYSDLRSDISDWKQSQILGWLVSMPNNSSTLDPEKGVPASVPYVEILGRGTLGDQAKMEDIVTVPKIKVGEGGSYAWWVSDNNQKASMALLDETSDNLNIAVTQKDDPGAVENQLKSYYRDGDSSFKDDLRKVGTYQTLDLVAQDSDIFGKHYHNFTHDASGLHSNTASGGLKKDLTPVLESSPSSASVSFAAPNSSWARSFNSASPIIPGSRHAMVGPSFDMLRAWAGFSNISGLSSGTIDAQVSPLHTGNPLRLRMPDSGASSHWPHDRSDGYTYKWDTWAQYAPRLHPVMTDCRWHYYFGHNSSDNELRTHIIPRVCLWNPYSVSMKVPQMVVLMSNPYWRYGNPFEFTVSSSTLNSLRGLAKYQTEPAKSILAKWDSGKFRAYGSAGNNINGVNSQGLFPDNRFLSFTLEEATIPPGECLVYSPDPKQNTISAGGIKIGEYNPDDTSQNVLSPLAPQGKDHFYFDFEKKLYELRLSGGSNYVFSTETGPLKDLYKDIMSQGGIERYASWAAFYDNFMFALKAANGPLNVGEEVLSSSQSFPTLQLLNGSNSGGTGTYNFWHYATWWGDSDSASNGQFGKVTSFQDTPSKQPPAIHQIGAKLMWLDESGNEGNSPPLRIDKWGDPSHVVYNQAPIANWNVRPNYISRSPSTFCSHEWYVNSLGAWIQQFAPDGPSNLSDSPSISSNGYFAKPPLGRTTQFGSAMSMVLFDLPNPDFGVVSMGSLRHAQLSPFSWHPSYIAGNSLANQHAPAELSAHPENADNFVPQSRIRTNWNLFCGGSSPNPLPYGPRNWEYLTSTAVLQNGEEAPSVRVEGVDVDVSQEIFAYDIAYEVNANLWDQYFISSIPVKGGDLQWTSNSLGQTLRNTRYSYNPYAKITEDEVEAKINGSDGAAYAFWNSAYFIKNKGAFNVNSTSVEAWAAFLSGLRNIKRETAGGISGGDELTVFARAFKPVGSSANANGSSPVSEDAWSGARVFTDAMIMNLAEQVVKEVKNRGPFLSMADFINRRLEKNNTEESQRGTLEAAIRAAGVNDQFLSDSRFKTTQINFNDFNKEEWKVDYSRQPESKAWGASGYLTQGDLLDSLAPSMTTRGDTFTIRAYGDATDKQGKIMAKAVIEAVVTRTPDFVDDAAIDETTLAGGKNRATDPVYELNRATAALELKSLGASNKQFGRKFTVVSVRWLNDDEI